MADLVVCRTHLRFVPCRASSGCEISSERSDVLRVTEYHQGAYARRVQELRRSSAATPVPSGKRYKRRTRRPEDLFD